MNPTILLIDDESRPMRFYRKALENSGFAVEQRFNPDDALSFLRTAEVTVSLIILDIMMPPGKTFERADTREGLNTGRFLFEAVRKEWPDTPIIVLTNVAIVELGPLSGGTLVFKKIDLDPFELASAVRAMVKEARNA